MDALPAEVVRMVPRTARELIDLQQCCRALAAMLSDDVLWLPLGMARFPRLSAVLAALPSQPTSYRALYKSQLLAGPRRVYIPTTTLKDYLFTLEFWAAQYPQAPHDDDKLLHVHSGPLDEQHYTAPLWDPQDAPVWFRERLSEGLPPNPEQQFVLRVLVTRVSDYRTVHIYSGDHIHGDHMVHETVFYQVEILSGDDGGFFPGFQTVSEVAFTSLDMQPIFRHDGSVCLTIKWWADQESKDKISAAMLLTYLERYAFV
jgi:hypothetical protein